MKNCARIGGTGIRPPGHSENQMSQAIKVVHIFGQSYSIQGEQGIYYFVEGSAGDLRKGDLRKADFEAAGFDKDRQ